MNVITSLKSVLEQTEITAENPGILEVPDNNNFWELPLSHYVDLVKKKGHAAVSRALVNLVRWNKNDDPDISAKAQKILDDLRAKVGQ